LLKRLFSGDGNRHRSFQMAKGDAAANGCAMLLALLFFAALWAGTQNALAGGGSFITLPALMVTGMTAQAANITSTIALFPAQVAAGVAGRAQVSGAAGLSFRVLTVISLIGGAVGAVILLITPADFFARLMPWLVLFATVVFAWGSFGPHRAATPRTGGLGTGATQFLISIYGGYFGGGIGFLMLAALSAAGLAVRPASATKNVLAGVMNASAVAVFAFSPSVHWLQAAIACVGATLGGILGGYMVTRVNERLLRVMVIVIGSALTLGLFIKGP
jgi:uncharacterized protein